MDIDIAECLRRGAVGAAGAVPGTLAAHPFDVVKMRQQVSGSPLAATARGLTLPSLYGGVSAGVAQKVATRGPMFLASEFFTQSVERHIGLARDRALFVGSAMSGYVTGFVAAGFEWVKVRGGVGVAMPSSTSKSASISWSRRLAVHHGAGIRNGIFDATFFGCEHAARHHGGLPPAVSYGAAAALAVALDYPVDAVVKRSMAAPPSEPARWPLHETFRSLRTRGLGVFAGLGAKACEFFISYAVTGACSTHVTRLLTPTPSSSRGCT